MADKKYVYFFGEGRAEGGARMKDLLGGKGANLAEMTNLGIPVPPGFTITADACVESMERQGEFPPGMWEQVEKNLKRLERATGLTVGHPKAPLLVSVRSGARISMPGMMDTVLNLGLNDEAVEGLADRSRKPRFAYDSYRRFMQMFGNVVMGISSHDFEEILERKKKERRVQQDTDLTAADLQEIIRQYNGLIWAQIGRGIPQDPMQQLAQAIGAVFASWNSRRATRYREINEIPHTWGTAVNIQAMVFGNMGKTSGAGVAFTRDPATGERRLFGEFLMDAQGEDVVSGIRTPGSIDQLQQISATTYRDLHRIAQEIEAHYRDMQDIEFVIQEGKLDILQTRTGKRTPAAAVKIAVDMEREGLIDKEEAVLRVDPHHVGQLLHPVLDPGTRAERVACGLPASPGAAVGRVVFTAAQAEECARWGEMVILVRDETSPEDIGGMHAARGVLTARGGMASHAAVVARGMGKPSVVGCSDIRIVEAERSFLVKDRRIHEGDWITIDGSTGHLMLGRLPLTQPEPSGDLALLIQWAAAYRIGQDTVALSERPAATLAAAHAALTEKSR